MTENSMKLLLPSFRMFCRCEIDESGETERDQEKQFNAFNVIIIIVILIPNGGNNKQFSSKW